MTATTTVADAHNFLYFITFRQPEEVELEVFGKLCSHSGTSIRWTDRDRPIRRKPPSTNRYYGQANLPKSHRQPPPTMANSTSRGVQHHSTADSVAKINPRAKKPKATELKLNWAKALDSRTDKRDMKFKFECRKFAYRLISRVKFPAM